MTVYGKGDHLWDLILYLCRACKGDFYGKTTPLKAIESDSLWERNLNASVKVIVYGKGDSLWEKMIILQRAALLVIISGDQLSREGIWQNKAVKIVKL